VPGLGFEILIQLRFRQQKRSFCVKGRHFSDMFWSTLIDRCGFDYVFEKRLSGRNKTNKFADGNIVGEAKFCVYGKSSCLLS